MIVINGIVVVQVQQVKIRFSRVTVAFCRRFLLEPRSVSMTRYLDPSEPVRGPSIDHFVWHFLSLFLVNFFFSSRNMMNHVLQQNGHHEEAMFISIRTIVTIILQRWHVLQPWNLPDERTVSFQMWVSIEVRKDLLLRTIVSIFRVSSNLIPIHVLQRKQEKILMLIPLIKKWVEKKKRKQIDVAFLWQIFKPDKVDIPDRLVDFDNDDQILTANERLAKLKKKEEVRKMLSKQR